MIASTNGLGYAIYNAQQYFQSARIVVGMLTMPDGFQLMLRESQIPPDVREYLKFRTQKEIDSIRQRMKAEKFTPPATQPAAPQDL